VPAALLLMDFQVGVVAGFPGSTQAVEAARAALDGARRHGVPVVFVRVGFRDGAPEATCPKNLADLGTVQLRDARERLRPTEIRKVRATESVCERVQVPHDLWRKLLKERHCLAAYAHTHERRISIRWIFSKIQVVPLQMQDDVTFARPHERANHILRTRGQHGKAPGPGAA